MCRASTPNNYQAVADCDASDDCVGFAVKKLGGDFYVTYSDLACVETNAYEDEGGHWDLYVSSSYGVCRLCPASALHCNAFNFASECVEGCAPLFGPSPSPTLRPR